MSLLFIAAWLGIGGVVGSAICAIAGCFSDEGAKRGEKMLPALMHFHEGNLTASDVNVLNGMVLQERDGNTMVFQNQDLTAYGEFSEVVGAAGVAHCDFSITIPGVEGAPRVGYGKLIAVDTRETSEADNDTITAFNELQRTAETTSSHMMKLLDVISDEASN